MHYLCESVSITIRNTLIPSPSTKEEGETTFRSGTWIETYCGMEYTFTAYSQEKIIRVSTDYCLGQDRKVWRDNFIFVVKRLHHIGLIAHRAIELMQAEASDDPKFRTAARGRLMTAIGAHII